MKNFFEPKAKSQQERIEQVNSHSQTTMADSQVEMFANRLRKNLKKLASWIKKTTFIAIAYTMRIYRSMRSP